MNDYDIRYHIRYKDFEVFTISNGTVYFEPIQKNADGSSWKYQAHTRESKERIIELFPELQFEIEVHSVERLI